MGSCNTPAPSTCWRRHGWPRSGLFPHGGNQMSLHIAGGFGLGGAEIPIPGVFGPFAGFADDAQLEDGYLKLPDRPASASKDRQRSTASCATSSRSAAKGSLLRSRMQKTKPPTGRSCSTGSSRCCCLAPTTRCRRLIERAGFTAYSIGGFALVGSRYGIPTFGLAAFGEISAGIRDIMAATSLPVMVDGDTGYGDVKNVAHPSRATRRWARPPFSWRIRWRRSAAATWPART